MSPVRTATILVACLCVCALGAAPVDDVVDPALLASENYRLPHTISPVHYNIKLRPYLLDTDGAKRFTFDGDVTIEIIPNEATKKIVLHSKNLNYTTREYWSKRTGVKMDLPQPVHNSVTDQSEYTLEDDLYARYTYYLHFVYTGTMDDDMSGFYRSSYVDSNNVTKWIGSTQFESNDARRAFPSFDEPRFKATFNVSLTRHNTMTSVSNTRNISHTTDGDYVTDTYATTPNMSTYLIAFIISEFKERTNQDFAVLARAEYYDQTQYTFDVGQKILQELDSYLGIKYYEMGIDKMHMAAIPDFSAGAMENWGLLTYRERALLYDEKSTTLSAKQYIAAVTAHEQTHMWFGDLVTCEWWSYTWLNEGFARYFQYFATAKVETDFELDDQFTVDQVQSVMGMDSTNGTNPMSDENTNTPADLSRMFNTITYNKGATVIRMVKHVMGEENFQKSLREYLQERKYKNAVPEHLFTFWRQYWPEQFKEYADPLFKSFTEQVGYPVVHVTVPTDRKSFNISQTRFLLKNNDNSNGSLLYTVPITYTTSNEKNFAATTPKFFLDASTKTHTIATPSNFNWIIVNVQQVGYYRVNYDEASWHNIHQSLYVDNWDGIHAINRAQIVDDLFNLARASVITYNLALQVLEYLETETHYLPWTSGFNGLNYLSIRLGTDNQDFNIYVRDLTNKAYKEHGFTETAQDNSLKILNRAKVLSWSCKSGHAECISNAKSLFGKMQTTPVPVNIRSVVYCTAMREGNETDFNTLFQKYKHDTVATEQTLILNSLGCVKNSALVKKYFDIIMSEDVRRQDKSSALTSLYSENNENVWPVYKLITEQYKIVADAMGGYSAVASAISNIAARFTEESQAQDLKKFNEEHSEDFGTSAKTLMTAEKTVSENLQWAKDKLSTFRSYLAKRASNASPQLTAYTALTIMVFAISTLLFQ